MLIPVPSVCKSTTLPLNSIKTEQANIPLTLFTGQFRRPSKTNTGGPIKGRKKPRRLSVDAAIPKRIIIRRFQPPPGDP